MAKSLSASPALDAVWLMSRTPPTEYALAALTALCTAYMPHCVWPALTALHVQGARECAACVHPMRRSCGALRSMCVRPTSDVRYCVVWRYLMPICCSGH